MTEGVDPCTSSGAMPRLISPGLASREEGGQAFEMKYQLTLEQATWFEGWARDHLAPDSYGDQGRYRVQSLYLDTSSLDVFHRLKGYRRSKFRVRRYDEAAHVFLERKSKRGSEVRKVRSQLPIDEIDRLAATDPVPAEWEAAWFVRKLTKRRLRPTCQIAYSRTAFFGMSENSPVRLTIDRNLIGRPWDQWHLPAHCEGQVLAPECALLELKFHNRMPILLQDLIPKLPTHPAKFSKYRRCVQACAMTTDVAPLLEGDALLFPSSESPRSVA
ncbi:MAG: polyphosphate polymerase domain-containing protein [Gemmataceae bacterium]|nr:polyphosphate polymerase domain-containing protein [Gemmataceae bacterium]